VKVLSHCSTCGEDRCRCPIAPEEKSSVRETIPHGGFAVMQQMSADKIEAYEPTADDYAADGIIPPKPRERFKLTLKAPYALTHPCARQPGNLTVYVYGEETDDAIVVTADIKPEDVLEIERAGHYDAATNRIVGDPEPSSMDDRQISA
jgi:hypothetical protein